MDVRLIVKEAGRRYTLPVKGVDEIIWSDDTLPDATEGGVLRCRRRGMDLMVIQTDMVSTIYRDDAPPSVARPRARRQRKPEPPTEPSPEPETEESA